jgi:hypothetical protein
MVHEPANCTRCGLEFVAMELSDCFGEDSSNLYYLGHAQVCFEDCYIAVYKFDGYKWARNLHEKVMGRLINTTDVFDEIRHIQDKEEKVHPMAANANDVHPKWQLSTCVITIFLFC